MKSIDISTFVNPYEGLDLSKVSRPKYVNILEAEKITMKQSTKIVFVESTDAEALTRFANATIIDTESKGDFILSSSQLHFAPNTRVMIYELIFIETLNIPQQ